MPTSPVTMEDVARLLGDGAKTGDLGPPTKLCAAATEISRDYHASTTRAASDLAVPAPPTMTVATRAAVDAAPKAPQTANAACPPGSVVEVIWIVVMMLSMPILIVPIFNVLIMMMTQTPPSAVLTKKLTVFGVHGRHGPIVQEPVAEDPRHQGGMWLSHPHMEDDPVQGEIGDIGNVMKKDVWVRKLMINTVEM